MLLKVRYKYTEHFDIEEVNLVFADEVFVIVPDDLKTFEFRDYVEKHYSKKIASLIEDEVICTLLGYQIETIEYVTILE